jgi:outer membrane protein assembly factor BamB
MGNFIYVGIKGSVLALVRATGQVAWQTALKSSDFVNVIRDGEDLFATTRGEVFCLDANSGKIRWGNALKGMGWGVVSVAASDGHTNLATAEQHRRAQQQAAGFANGAPTGGI